MNSIAVCCFFCCFFFFFFFNQIRPVIAMATYSYYWLIIGTSENWHLLLSHCKYIDETFTEMFLESPLPNIPFLLQPFNFIGYQGNICEKNI